VSAITHRTELGEGYQMCQCHQCGIVARCTPRFDFYAKNVGDPLQCESCFREECAAQGLKLNLLPPVEGGQPS
jgi:hypothetical protein